MRQLILTSFVFAISLLPSCLPADVRPEPGQVFATTQIPQELQDTALTFENDDGWSMSVSELMVVFGGIQLSGEGCSSYANANYARIVNLQQPGPQKVAQAWGLDDCNLGYYVGKPGENAVVGANVMEAELELMTHANVPVSSSSGIDTSQGMALHIVGTLNRGDVKVDFDWGFADELDFGGCKRNFDGTIEPFLPLEGGETLKVELVVDPRYLFRVDNTSLVQAIVDADQVNGNANGRVAVNELIATSVTGFPENLGEVLRKKAYPSMFRFEGNDSCMLNVFDRNGPGGRF